MRGYATPARCSQRNVPAAESANWWRFGEVFDRWAAMTAPGGGGSPLNADDPSTARKNAFRAYPSRGTRFARRSPIHVCFSKNEAVPTVFYNFAASRPGFLARNLPNSLARHGTALRYARGGARLVFLGSFPWQVL
jgi:hypothetical protein